MKIYWYAAGLKGGGVMVFSARRKYTKISARQLKTRFDWLSKPHASQSEAAVFLGKKVGFRNPPQKVTVMHGGKITIQHLSDPRSKTKKNPKRVKKDLKSIVLEEDKGMFWDPEQLRWRRKTKKVEEEIRRRYGAKMLKENPQAHTFSRWQATCRRAYGNIVTFFNEAGQTYCTYHGKMVGFWNDQAKKGVVYAQHAKTNPMNHLGEKVYMTYKGWRRAIEKKHQFVLFEGNEHTSGASIERGGRREYVGIWNGSTGTVFKLKNPPISWHKKQLAKYKRDLDKMKKMGVSHTIIEHYEGLIDAEQIAIHGES